MNFGYIRKIFMVLFRCLYQSQIFSLGLGLTMSAPNCYMNINLGNIQYMPFFSSSSSVSSVFKFQNGLR